MPPFPLLPKERESIKTRHLKNSLLLDGGEQGWGWLRKELLNGSY